MNIDHLSNLLWILKKSFISGSLLTKLRLVQPPPQQLEVPQMQLLAHRHHHQLDHQPVPQLQLHLRRVPRSNNLIYPVVKEGEEVAQVSRIWTSNNPNKIQSVQRTEILFASSLQKTEINMPVKNIPDNKQSCQRIISQKKVSKNHLQSCFDSGEMQGVHLDCYLINFAEFCFVLISKNINAELRHFRGLF